MNYLLCTQLLFSKQNRALLKFAPNLQKARSFAGDIYTLPLSPVTMKSLLLFSLLHVVLLKEAYSTKLVDPLSLLTERTLRSVEPLSAAMDVDLRQTDVSSLIECSFIALEQQCKGDYIQQAVDFALSCGNESLARLLADSCSRKESGEFCSEALVDSSLSQFSVPTSCQSSSCETSCREFLESIVSSLGCCVSTYTVTTLLSSIADAELWSLCGVEIPAKCTSDVEMNIPSDIDTCTDKELARGLAEAECKPSNGQPIVDELLKNSNCTTLARLLVEECGINANGEICSEVITADVLPNPGVDDSPLFADIFTECQASPNTVFSCDSSCANFIEDVIDSYGCCVNIFNDTSLFGQQYSSLSYEVWKSCGYDTLGKCTESFSSVGTVESFVVLVVTAVLLIQEVVM